MKWQKDNGLKMGSYGGYRRFRPWPASSISHPLLPAFDRDPRAGREAAWHLDSIGPNGVAANGFRVIRPRSSIRPVPATGMRSRVLVCK